MADDLANAPEPAIDSPYAFDHTPAGERYWQEEGAMEAWLNAGAPSPLALYLELHGQPKPEDDRPLTVAQAAEREGCSTKTIRRRLPVLAALEPPGAYKVGTTWRIVPGALDGLHEVPQAEPEDKPTPRRRRTPKAKPGKSSTRWSV